MKKYTKTIYSTGTGMVRAEVKDNATGADVGSEWFMGIFSTNASVERRMKKAHAWCDERIRILENLAVGESDE